MAVVLAVTTGCGASFLPGGGPCRSAGPVVALPPEVPESSGVAPGILKAGEHPGPGFFWTHNDSGWGPELFAVTPEGALVGQVRVQGAENVDWEDMAAAPCGDQRCLYIADTGDNLEGRDDPAIYRIVEPHPDDSVSAPARRFPLHLPHGPRDVEAMVILPGEELLLISKGRNHPVEVYRSPGSLPEALARSGEEPVVLQRVQRLTSSPTGLPRMVTGAASSPDGSRVAVRTYETLHFYRLAPDAQGGPLVPSPSGLVNLRSLREPQGEAVAFVSREPDGRSLLVLTSEAGPGGTRGQMTVLSCRVP